MKDAFYSNYSSENQKNSKKILERLRQTSQPLSIKELYSSFLLPVKISLLTPLERC